VSEEALGDGPMLWTVDKEADAAYLEINFNTVVETRNFGVVNVDLDQWGRAVGVELLSLHPDRARSSQEELT
jgi:uncharacterized protein YuzE